MKLIVGLGNPGLSYRATRHNAGARSVEKLAKQEKWAFQSDRSARSMTAAGEIAGLRVCLVLPQTFMNLSGEAVAALMKKKRIASCDDVLIVYDDVALPLGELKIKAAGSDGGHHGLASVIGVLGTREVPRLRLGIGQPGMPGDLSAYVLSRFDKEELGPLEEMTGRSTEAMRMWVEKGVHACMNHFNKKTREEPSSA